MLLQPENVGLGFLNGLLDRCPELTKVRQLRKPDELRELRFGSERFRDRRDDPAHGARDLRRVPGVEPLPVGLEPGPEEASAQLVLGDCPEDLGHFVVLDRRLVRSNFGKKSLEWKQTDI